MEEIGISKTFSSPTHFPLPKIARYLKRDFFANMAFSNKGQNASLSAEKILAVDVKKNLAKEILLMC